MAVRMHAKDRALREKVYRAYLARASEFSQTEKKEDGKGDNAPLIEKILSLRLEKAKLLGYENFAEVSMAKKMAGMRGGGRGGGALSTPYTSVCLRHSHQTFKNCLKRLEYAFTLVFILSLNHLADTCRKGVLHLSQISVCAST